jgi:hypothetical protein
VDLNVTVIIVAEITMDCVVHANNPKGYGIFKPDRVLSAKKLIFDYMDFNILTIPAYTN